MLRACSYFLASHYLAISQEVIAMAIKATVTINMKDNITEITEKVYRAADMKKLFESVKCDYPNWSSMVIVIVNL
jgi:hypothetical protein